MARLRVRCPLSPLPLHPRLPQLPRPPPPSTNPKAPSPSLPLTSWPRCARGMPTPSPIGDRSVDCTKALTRIFYRQCETSLLPGARSTVRPQLRRSWDALSPVCRLQTRQYFAHCCTRFATFPVIAGMGCGCLNPSSGDQFIVLCINSTSVVTTSIHRFCITFDSP